MKLIAPIFLALFATTSIAQVYQCADQNGRLVLTDSPCADGRLLSRKRSAEEVIQDNAAAAAARQRFERDNPVRMERENREAEAVVDADDGSDQQSCQMALRNLEVIGNRKTGSAKSAELEAARRRADLACYGKRGASNVEAARQSAPKSEPRRRVTNCISRDIGYGQVVTTCN